MAELMMTQEQQVGAAVAFAWASRVISKDEYNTLLQRMTDREQQAMVRCYAAMYAGALVVDTYEHWMEDAALVLC